jgi:Protein of unknown function (DUF1573)
MRPWSVCEEHGLEESPEPAVVGIVRRASKGWRAGLAVGAVVCLGILVFASRPRAHVPGELAARQRLVLWEGAAEGPTPSGRAQGRFELVNRGDDPVRIVGFTSGCGCATPTADREIVMPGAIATVRVTASVAPFATRDIPIMIQTDSKKRPDLELTFRVVGSRRPPFLFAVSDVPSVIDDPQALGEKLITVETVEPAGEAKSPLVSSTLGFISFRQVDVHDVPHVEGALLRKRRYAMVLAPPLPSGTSAGMVTVTDPWDSSNSRAFNVLVRPPQGDVTVWASTIVLGREAGSEVQILVKTREPADNLAVQLDGPDGPSVSVGPTSVGQSGRFHKLTLAVRRRLPAGGSRELRMRIGVPFAGAPLVVPVQIASQ